MTEPAMADGFRPDPELAALMESPEFLAQMAAMQAQAQAQLEALIAALNAAAGQLQPPPDHKPGDGAPIDIALPPPEPVFLPPKPGVDGTDAGNPGGAGSNGRGFGMELHPLPREMMAWPAVEPTLEELAIDMLAVLPAIAVAPPAEARPAEAPPPSEPWQWTWADHGGNGGEGGII